MKRISLKKLSLSNFKGIKSLDINFDKDLTEILGENATGKTTIFDSFTWLLFGKDHNDKSVFEIKTLDSNNKAIPKLNHEVEALLLVNDEEVKIRRSYKEKWVKQRGSLDAVLQGHTTSYFYNDVPVTLTEFNDKTKLLIDEQIFKLITNPFYFNSLPWATRREVLTTIAKVVSDQDIANENVDFLKLLNELNGKSFDDFKKIINAKKKKVKLELDEIPTRIDELYKSLPESEDFEELEKLILQKKLRQDELYAQIVDNSKVDQEHTNKIKVAQNDVTEFQFSTNKLYGEAEKIHNQKVGEYDRSINEQKRKIQQTGFDVETLKKKVEFKTSERRKSETQLAELRMKFDEKQSEVFVLDENDASCPTCKREYDFLPQQIAEMEKNFNIKKAEALDNINLNGKRLKDLLESVKKANEETIIDLEFEESKIKTLNEELVILEQTVVLSTEECLEPAYYKNIAFLEEAKKYVETLRNTVIEQDVVLIKSLENERDILYDEIAELNKRLFKKDQISNGKVRIEKLGSQAKIFAQEIADLEAKEFLIEKFNSIKINRIETSINELFPTVRFRLFNYQLNGGVTECCETLINGVPFSDANNAAKIQAGIEIINILSEYHKCTAPIFVDNAESIVNVPFTSSQLIKLVVSKNHKSLTVN